MDLVMMSRLVGGGIRRNITPTGSTNVWDDGEQTVVKHRPMTPAVASVGGVSTFKVQRDVYVRGVFSGASSDLEPSFSPIPEPRGRHPPSRRRRGCFRGRPRHASTLAAADLQQPVSAYQLFLEKDAILARNYTLTKTTTYIKSAAPDGYLLM